jgi:hypothetical protein
MAIVTFSITDVAVSYNNWSGTFEVGNLDVPVKDDDSVVITINSGPLFTFNSVKVLGWVDNNLDHNYVTWRTQSYVTNPTQYPTNGESLDIWSYNFHRDVFTLGYTWNQLTSTYSDLNTVKHTLAYDYDVPYAPYYSRGGTLTIIK